MAPRTSAPRGANALVEMGAIYNRLFSGSMFPISEKFRTRFGKGDVMDRINACINQANMGLMLYLTDLGRETLELDPHTNTVAAKRFGAIAALDWTLTPASGPGIDEKLATEIADTVRGHLQRMRGLKQAIYDIAWGVFDGRALIEIDWRYQGGRYPNVPVAVEWVHPRRLAFGPHRELCVIDTFRAGISWWTYNGVPVENLPGKFVRWLPRYFNDYSEREGLLRRSLYWIYFKRFAAYERMVFTELFGKPLRVVEWEKPEVGAPALNKETYQDAAKEAEQLGGTTTASMPPGAGLKIWWPGTAGSNADLYSGTVKDVDSQMSRLWLGNEATTVMMPSGMGSQSAVVQSEEQNIYLERDAGEIGDRFQEDLIRVDVILNWGPDYLDHAPRFTLHAKDEVDRDAEQKRLNAAITIGVPVKVSQYSERTGIDIPNDEEKIIVLGDAGRARILDQAAERAKASGSAAPPGSVVLAPDDMAAVTIVNEARSGQGRGPLLLPDGRPDPDGLLTIYAYRVKTDAQFQAPKGPPPGGDPGDGRGDAPPPRGGPGPALPGAPKPPPALPPGPPAAKPGVSLDRAPPPALSEGGAFRLPPDHHPVMHKPAGGAFLCRDCRFLSEDGRRCGNEDFIAFQGKADLPYPADEMCSDWFEPKPALAAERRFLKLSQAPAPLRLAMLPEHREPAEAPIIKAAAREGAKLSGAWGHLLCASLPAEGGRPALRHALSKAAEHLPLAPFAGVVERAIVRGALHGAARAHEESFVDAGQTPLPPWRLEGDREEAPAAAPLRPLPDALADFTKRNILPLALVVAMRAEAKERAAKVAELARQDMLRAAEEELDDTDSDDADDLRERIADRFESRGWTPENDSHVALVFSVAVTSAYHAGRAAQMDQPDVLKARPYRLIRGIDDANTRPPHGAAHGAVLRGDDPFWARAPLPWGINCRCLTYSLTADDLRNLGLTVVDGSTLKDLPDEGFKSTKLFARDQGVALAGAVRAIFLASMFPTRPPQAPVKPQGEEPKDTRPPPGSPAIADRQTAAAPDPTPPAGNETAVYEEEARPPVALEGAKPPSQLAQCIRDELTEDFPPEATEWVLHVPWRGPEAVSIDRIDMSDRATWRASNDPDRVVHFARAIKAGRRVKPIILVQTPDGTKLVAVDGHHRLLAHEMAAVPPRAYIARVPTATGPWTEMHAQQIRGPSFEKKRFEREVDGGPFVLDGNPVLDALNDAFDRYMTEGARVGSVLVYEGIRVRIDRPVGFVQTGTGVDGTPWSRTYTVPYGEILGTEGGDGEPLDVFCGPVPDAPVAYWAEQKFPDGSFDEFKLGLGWADQGAFVAAYLAHIPAQFLGRVWSQPVEQVKALLGLNPQVRAERGTGDHVARAKEASERAALLSEDAADASRLADGAPWAAPHEDARDAHHAAGLAHEDAATDHEATAQTFPEGTPARAHHTIEAGKHRMLGAEHVKSADAEDGHARTKREGLLARDGAPVLLDADQPRDRDGRWMPGAAFAGGANHVSKIEGPGFGTGKLDPHSTAKWAGIKAAETGKVIYATPDDRPHSGGFKLATKIGVRDSKKGCSEVHPDGRIVHHNGGATRGNDPVHGERGEGADALALSHEEQRRDEQKRFGPYPRAVAATKRAAAASKRAADVSSLAAGGAGHELHAIARDAHLDAKREHAGAASEHEFAAHAFQEGSVEHTHHTVEAARHEAAAGEHGKRAAAENRQAIAKGQQGLLDRSQEPPGELTDVPT